MLDEQQQLFVGLVVNIVRRIRIVTRYLSNTTYFTKIRLIILRKPRNKI